MRTVHIQLTERGAGKLEKAAV